MSGQEYSFYSDQCNFPLPEFKLDTQNTIQVGSNILANNWNSNHFQAHQNAKFLMRVLDESKCHTELGAGK